MVCRTEKFGLGEGLGLWLGVGVVVGVGGGGYVKMSGSTIEV